MLAGLPKVYKPLGPYLGNFFFSSHRYRKATEFTVGKRYGIDKEPRFLYAINVYFLIIPHSLADNTSIFYFIYT